jgi:nucleotide-binding universal stress UspA family protein
MDADIVVGLDDSPSAWAALTWAAGYARSTGARLRAVHVLDRPEAWEAYETPVVSSFVYPDADALDPVWTVRARTVFAKLEPEPTWTLQFAKGHPGQVMVETSRDASLLVLGTREHRGMGRLLNGSVSHYCINHAACPVVAVPTTRPDVGPVDPAADVAAQRSNRDRATMAP